jgi:hypothetical protein
MDLVQFAAFLNNLAALDGTKHSKLDVICPRRPGAVKRH